MKSARGRRQAKWYRDHLVALVCVLSAVLMLLSGTAHAEASSGFCAMYVRTHNVAVPGVRVRDMTCREGYAVAFATALFYSQAGTSIRQVLLSPPNPFGPLGSGWAYTDWNISLSTNVDPGGVEGENISARVSRKNRSVSFVMDVNTAGVS